MVPGADAMRSGITVPLATDPVELKFQRWVTFWAWAAPIRPRTNRQVGFRSIGADPRPDLQERQSASGDIAVASLTGDAAPGAASPV